MKELDELRYDATRAKLDENLIRMDVVNMISKKELTNDIYYSALSYLMFLNKNRNSKIKAK